LFKLFKMFKMFKTYCPFEHFERFEQEKPPQCRFVARPVESASGSSADLREVRRDIPVETGATMAGGSRLAYPARLRKDGQRRTATL
jgi:hypothetical protein